MARRVRIQLITDRVFLVFFMMGMYGMLILVLSNQYATEALALFILSLAGFLFVKRTKDSSDLNYMWLLAVPIAMKLLLYSYLAYADITEVVVGTLVSIYSILSMLGISILVAIGEETFRAIFYIFVKYLKRSESELDGLAIMVSNIAWILLHFIRRINEIALFPGLTAYYVLWLFIAGIVLNIILVRVGLGYAVLGHFLINSF